MTERDREQIELLRRYIEENRISAEQELLERLEVYLETGNAAVLQIHGPRHNRANWS